MVINRKTYDFILKEHFDCRNDKDTRQIMLSVNESDQEQILTSLTSKLYDHIVNKIDDIDFGTIPQSGGDITKIENYDQMIDCLSVIKSYLIEFKQSTEAVDIIETSIKNILDRKDIFMRGFKFDVEFIMVTYSSLVLAIVSSVGMLITSSIEFIKEPGQDDFSIVVDKVALQKTKNNLLFNNLKKFNKSCSSREFDKAMDYVLANVEKHFMGSMSAATGVIAGIALAGIILNIIPIIRELIFYFYHSRVTISDYMETQADLLQINAYNVQNSTDINAKSRKDIVNKQMKMVAIFRKISNFFSIDSKQAEIKATKEVAESKKKYKANELVDSKPDSAETSTGSSLF